MRSRTLTIALAAVLAIGALPASADAVDTAVNSSRSTPLVNRPELESVAASSAARQAAAGSLSHTSLGGLTAVCSSAGEIVGVGSSIQVIFDSFRASPYHRDLLVSPAWTAMGTAAVTGGDGRIYVSVVFCTELNPSAPAPPPPPPPPPQPAPAPSTAGQTGVVSSAPSVSAGPVITFADVFRRLLSGELDDLWLSVLGAGSTLPQIGPGVFLPEALWFELTAPAVD